MRSLFLALVLSVLWVGMSGHFSPIILGLGVLGVALTVWLAGRMSLVDREGVPAELVPAALPYSAWLGAEVVKSNIEVAKRILRADPALTPELVELEDGQSTDVGRALYGNSITLTPGTITVASEGSTLHVHALTAEGARDLEGGAMRDRVARVDGARPGGTA
ncbi:MAG: Na+/H+ antiporter subunit E [Planctomycetota bacterium]